MSLILKKGGVLKLLLARFIEFAELYKLQNMSIRIDRFNLLATALIQPLLLIVIKNFNRDNLRLLHHWH